VGGRLFGYRSFEPGLGWRWAVAGVGFVFVIQMLGGREWPRLCQGELGRVFGWHRLLVGLSSRIGEGFG